LFSREDVSNYINQNFEAAWEMVRPVPIVRIDFGNGRTATRTLHGNVASYVCARDGQVMDILPGIYQPAAYTAALEPPRALTGVHPDRRPQYWQDYHRDRAQALRNPPAPVAPRVAQAPPRLDRGKGSFERPLEMQVLQARMAEQLARAALAANRGPNGAAAPRPRNAAELAAWQPLAADTLLNETERRLQIHDRLAATVGAVRPEQIKTWLYRDVLHADLDDPFMGLGDDMFADFER
jgi:hypothetical protein